MNDAFLIEAAKRHEKIADTLDGVAEALEAYDSYDVAVLCRTFSSIARSVSEYYETCPHTQGAYSGAPDKRGASAHQVFSSRFLEWLAKKAMEEERKALNKRSKNLISERRDGACSATNDELYEEPDE